MSYPESGRPPEPWQQPTGSGQPQLGVPSPGGQQPPAGGQPPWGAQPQWGQQPQWGGQQPGWPQQPWGGAQDRRWPSPGGHYPHAAYVAPPKPGTIPLRPLLFGEILDGSFQTIRRNAAPMFGSALIFQVISAGLAGVIGVMTLSLAGRIPYMERESMDEILGPMLGIFMAGLGATVLSAFLGSVLQGVMVVPVSRSVLNRRTGFKQMWTLTGSRIWPLLGVAALLTLGSLLAAAAFVGLSALLLAALGPAGLVLVFLLGLGALVAFLWIAMKLLVAPAVVVVEEAGVYESLLRSWRLTKSNWWRIFGIVVVISLMIGVISNIVQIPLSVAAGGIGSVVAPHGGVEAFTSTSMVLTIVSLAVTALIGAVGFAYQSSANALIYFDLRMRRDGLDVELLRLLESGGDADGIPGRPVSTSGRGASWPAGNVTWPGTPPGPGQPRA